MRQVLQVLVFGLIAGSIYGLLSLGVVLTFRGSRVLNLALGEIGTVALFVGRGLLSAHLPYVVAAVLAVAFAVALGIGFERAVVTPMRDADRLTVTVASIGLLTLLVSGEFFLFGRNSQTIAPAISGTGLTVAGVVVSANRLLGLGVAALLAVGLAALLKRSDFGLGVLAAAQDARAARLVGIPLARVSMFVWGASAGLAAVAGFLVGPDLGALAPGFLGRLFVLALAGAVVGGLSSLPGAFVGGLVVGVLEAAIDQLTLTVTSVPGLSVDAVFALILVVLLVRPQGLLGGRSRA